MLVNSKCWSWSQWYLVARRDAGEDKEEESLCSFGYHISVHIHYTFSDYILINGNEYVVERTMIWLVHRDSLVATVLTCLEHPEKQGELRKKVYTNTFTSHVSDAVRKLIEKVFKFVQIRQPEDLNGTSEINASDSEKNYKQKVRRQPRHAMHVFWVLFVRSIFWAVESEWLTKYGRNS